MFGGSHTENGLEKQLNGNGAGLNSEANVISLDSAADHAPPTSGTTLLPRPIASLVSLVTHSTSLSLRLGSFFGGVALDGARVTTLTGLELSRAVIEGVLSKAGRDVAIRSSGDRGKVEAESLLERSLAALHSTVTSASFFAAATFHLSSTTLSSVSHLSQTLLSTLDAILGSSESSRAIAAIVTLIRREFRKSEGSTGTDVVGVGDLLVGVVGFALLQRWGRKNTEGDLHETCGDETVWDIVILDNGVRADVVGTRQLDYVGGAQHGLRDGPGGARASFMSLRNDDEAFNAVERPTSAISTIDSPHLALPPEEQHQISEEAIRLYIMQQLPQGCRASIRTDMVTARTITVDVFDDDMAEIPAPPGTKMIAERFHNDGDRTDENGSNPQHPPKHTVVFRTAFSRSQNADVIPHMEQDNQLDPYHSGSEVRGAVAAPAYDEVTGTRPLLRKDRIPNTDQTHEASDRRKLETIPTVPKRIPRDNDNRPNAPESKASKDLHARPNNTRIAPQNKSREQSSTSSHSEPETTSSARGPFARFADRVRPSGAEKTGSRKQQPSKKQRLGFMGSKLPQPNEMSTVPTPESTNMPQKFSAKPTPKMRPREPISPGRQIPGRDPMRAPLPNSSRVRSAIPRYAHSRDVRSPTPDLFSVREKNRDSFIAQTDSYSFLPADKRPGSPGITRGHMRSNSSMSMTRSGAETTVSLSNDGRPTSSTRHRPRSSSICSLATAGSESSVILAPRPRSSAYDESDMIRALNRDGLVPGIFPERHFVRNVRRFCRFSSASYGSNALKVMGVPSTNSHSRPQTTDSHEHSAFLEYAGLPPSSILLSSFVDPEGGTNAAGETDTGFPLVHYLCLDHESKAIVLALRGTWGFEDVLTDMTCDYDDLEWQGKNWKVHKGMHASAKRLLHGGSGRVMVTIRAALDEFPDYGVVFCGHSLGGGVAALLATMISQPNDDETSGTSFVTASHESTLRHRLLLGDVENRSQTSYFLPPGRPIHVYAYGPPALMSPLLRRATRGLVTTVVNGQDVVPSLSLGVLHDMHAVSVAFKGDVSGAKSHVRSRFWEGLRQNIINKFYVNQAPMVVHAGDGIGEDAWAWKTLKMLREEMCAPKLMPPGEVFVVDTIRVLQRDAFTAPPSDSYPRLGRPATRVQLKFMRNVESWFGELRFGSGMFTDHNPARYEASIAALARGILDL